jgi:hypothetical protein
MKAKRTCRADTKIQSPGPSHYYQGDTILDTFKYIKSMALGTTPAVIGYEVNGLIVKRRGQGDIKPIFLSFDDLMVKE